VHGTVALLSCVENRSHALGDRRLVIPVRKSMTPYSQLIVRNNPPLPLQVREKFTQQQQCALQQHRHAGLLCIACNIDAQ
jgi:hypothetical protein